MKKIEAFEDLQQHSSEREKIRTWTENFKAMKKQSCRNNQPLVRRLPQRTVPAPQTIEAMPYAMIAPVPVDGTDGEGTSVGAAGSIVGSSGTSVGFSGTSVGSSGTSVGSSGASVGSSGTSVGFSGVSSGYSQLTPSKYEHHSLRLASSAKSTDLSFFTQQYL